MLIKQLQMHCSGWKTPGNVVISFLIIGCLFGAIPVFAQFEDYKLPQIDLTHWKVQIPEGKPSNYRPPKIYDYASIDALKPFMYNDSTDGSLVFYAYPANTTKNSRYSRSELREQLESGSDRVNWTFAQGGRMKGRLKVTDVSQDERGKYHKVIVMQIHGRLSEEQKMLIGKDDYDAPPVLKVYWQNNRIRVKTKQLKDTTQTDLEYIVTKKSWKDDKGQFFKTKVGNEPFTLEVIASNGRLEVILNDSESFVYDDIHMKKWSVFENYFKAGNYLQTRDQGASAKVKYYELTVEH